MRVQATYVGIYLFHHEEEERKGREGRGVGVKWAPSEAKGYHSELPSYVF